MPGHSMATNHKFHSHTHGSGRYRAEGFRQSRTNSRDSATSQESYRDHYDVGQEPYHDPRAMGQEMGKYVYRDQYSTGQDPYQDRHGSGQDSHRDHRTTGQDSHRDSTVQSLYLDRYSEQPRAVDTQPSRKAPPRYANGQSSETLGFIPGSAAGPVGAGQACSSCSSLGWSSCRALLCCVLTCGFYGNRQPCLPANESSTDAPPRSEPEPRKTPLLAMSNPTCGVPLEPSKPSQLPSSESFRYPDVRLAGRPVYIPGTNSEAPPRRSKAAVKGDNQRPISNTSIYSREDLDVDDVDDGGMDIDSLITKKLLELYKLHQIEQLAKCTSDHSFSRKTNEISDLINSIAQDYNLEEQEAECRLVRGVIRISTRKCKSPSFKGYNNKDYRSQDALLQPNVRRDGTLPDSGNETMTFTFSNGEPEVQVSDLTPSDELARRMRVHSGRSAYYSSSAAATDSSGAPLLC